MKAVFLDADTLGSDIDLSPIANAVDQLTIYPQTTPEQLSDHLDDADLIITNKVLIGENAMQGRSAVFVTATGINNIDTEAAKVRQLPIYNVTDYGTHSVAQHTLMLMTSLAFQLPRYHRDIQEGAWQQSPSFCLMQHSTTDLNGKTLVIVGEGNIGKRVAELAKALGMRVFFCARPNHSEDRRPALTELLPSADVLSVHCPLNEDTYHLLNRENLKLLKPTCLVINCARGGVIDEAACLNALRANQIGGLGIDTLPVEPPINSHPALEALEEDLNLIVTPHNAWVTREARQNIVNLTAENIKEFQQSLAPKS